MRRSTAKAVIDILEQVDFLLRDGRPRKPLGKPRPEAIIFPGQPVSKINGYSLLTVEKMSLPGAFKILRKEEGYTRYQIMLAKAELAWGYYDRTACYMEPLSIEDIDAIELDTRQIRRSAKQAARLIEEIYLS